MGDWDWLKDKTEPATTPPPPLPGPSPASKRSVQQPVPPSSAPPPLPGPSPAARDSQIQPTTSLSPPRLPGPSPAARDASKTVQSEMSSILSPASTARPLLPQFSAPAPAPGPIDASGPTDDIEVDPGLLLLAEQTARDAALLHEAVLQQLRSEDDAQDLPGEHFSSEEPAMSESPEERELIPMGDDGIPSRSFLKVVGFISSYRGISCLRVLSQVCQRWRTALQPSLFLFKSIRGTLKVYGSRRGSTEEVNTNRSQSAESSRRSSVEMVSARPSLDFPPAVAAATGLTIINRGLQGLQGLAAMRGQEQDRVAHAALAARVEEMERTAAALKAEREQLFAQVQDGALQKKARETAIGELQAQWDAAVARGERPVEEGDCVRCAEAGEVLEGVEGELAVAMEERKGGEEARVREKKVLVAEVQRHRELQRQKTPP